MATIQIKRRHTGAAGPPASLKSGELAYNDVDNILYFGFGDDGSGNALTVIPVGGAGAFAKIASPALTGTPTAPTAATNTNTTQVATTAFVQSAVSGVTGGNSGVIDGGSY